MRVEIGEYIIMDSEICHGKPVFKGTRIMVWQVLEMLRLGYKEEEILEQFPSLTNDHIREALRFAASKFRGEELVRI
ncbi:DUF433 domain-containing protein [bacterium]|nr:DUF433 domain-containing protein [bacterium]